MDQRQRMLKKNERLLQFLLEGGARQDDFLTDMKFERIYKRRSMFLPAEGNRVGCGNFFQFRQEKRSAEASLKLALR